MKDFTAPMMSVQRLEQEGIIATSNGCQVEVLACEDCYCTSVTCDGTYVCDAQRCPTLDSL